MKNYNNKVVYAWCENDKPFYIGIGSLKRSKRLFNRNPHTLSKRKKCEKEGTFSIEILFTNLTWKEACKIECQLIKQYGRRDLGTGILTNMTDGGDGNPNPSRDIRGHKNPNYGRGSKNYHQSIPVHTPYGDFDSLKDAAKHIGVSPDIIKTRCRNSELEDYYIRETGKPIPNLSLSLGKPVYIPQGLFPSVSEASRSCVIPKSTLLYRIKSLNFPEYYYV